MRRRFGWFAAVLTLAAGAAFAQEGMERIPAPPGITVQGRGEVQVKPDIVRLSLGVQTQNAQSAVAAGENAEVTSRVIAAVKAAGVADRDIQTTDYSIQPQYDYRPRPNGEARPPAIIGYQVNNTVRVTVRRIGDASKVIDAAVKAGANVAGVIAFDTDDPSAGKDAALRKAVADALRKARVVAEAAGIADIRLVAVTEGSIGFARPMESAMMMRAAVADAAQTPVQPGEQTVTAFVTVRFAFAPANPQR